MATIDDMLGPASGRFLTGAAQHVQRTVRQVTVKADGEGRVRVTGRRTSSTRVSGPKGWRRIWTRWMPA